MFESILNTALLFCFSSPISLNESNNPLVVSTKSLENANAATPLGFFQSNLFTAMARPKFWRSTKGNVSNNFLRVAFEYSTDSNSSISISGTLISLSNLATDLEMFEKYLNRSR